MTTARVLRLGVCGASGRAGREVLRVLPEFAQFKLCAAIVSPDSASRGQALEASLGSGLSYHSDIASIISGTDVWIDFSSPKGTRSLLLEARKAGKPVVVLTTGHDDATTSLIKESSADLPILLCSNASLGVFAMHEASRIASRILGDKFQVEILEIHHKHKKDSPSGTALSLARMLAKDRQEEVVSYASGRSGARGEKEIGLESLRGGDVVGEHTVYFLGAGERLEITHRASDRAIFARGALELAAKLYESPAGLYSAADLLCVKN